MFPVIHGDGDSSQAVFTPPVAVGARPDDHDRLIVTNVNLVVCPRFHPHNSLWGHAAPKGCEGSLGREDDQDTAATKCVFFGQSLMYKTVENKYTHTQHYSPPPRHYESPDTQGICQSVSWCPQCFT